MKILENVSLAKRTTFGLGGKARYFLEVTTKDEVREAWEFAQKKGLPIFVLGGGSNLLVGEGDFAAVVIQIKYQVFQVKGDRVTLGSGLDWDEAVARCVDQDLQGVECLSGIPGTMGAAPVQNIGAYGQEIGESLVEVIAFDTQTAKWVVLTKDQSQFGYRDSVFKKNKGRFVIWEVVLKLKPGFPPTTTYSSLVTYLSQKGITNPDLKAVRKTILAIRRGKFEDPKRVGNAGSFFKNPVVSQTLFEKLKRRYPNLPAFPVDEGVKLAAGWLIETAGWKGKRLGTAKVSDQHALVLVNPGGAKPTDVKNLALAIQAEVKNKFGVDLEPEVQFINL